MVRESVTYYDGQSVRRSREQPPSAAETLLLPPLNSQLARARSLPAPRFSAPEARASLPVTLHAACLAPICVPVQVPPPAQPN